MQVIANLFYNGGDLNPQSSGTCAKPLLVSSGIMANCLLSVCIFYFLVTLQIQNLFYIRRLTVELLLEN